MGNTCCTVSPVVRESMERMKELRDNPFKKDVNKFIAKTTDRENPCAICLEPMKRGDLIFRVKCGHMYHGYCLVKWSQRNSTCPFCNIDIKI